MNQYKTTYEVYDRIKSLARTYHADISPLLDDNFLLDGKNALWDSFCKIIVILCVRV